MQFTIFDFHEQAHDRGENGRYWWAIVNLLYDMNQRKLTFMQAAHVRANVTIDYKFYKRHIYTISYYVSAAKKRYPDKPTAW